MRLTRLLLNASVILAGYCTALAVSVAPVPCAVLFIMACAAKKGYRFLTAFGTARWSNLDDLRRAGMLNGKGLILGRTAEKPRLLPSTLGLFSPRVGSSIACRQFLTAIQGRKVNELVRLPNAIHSAVFAPTGAGKGVSFVIPHGLT
ncbi:MAG TPA: type IV secretory system conjugative DNA transfer family protein, partial [Candidatus Methylomirabilis sp.]|nr:type IV secretory system conjugative DNA transfer family protein [Candidatus Methylomirabilis sp.]